jgi:hypothetical protein
MTVLFDLLIDKIGNPNYLYCVTQTIAYFLLFENINLQLTGGYSGFGSRHEDLEITVKETVDSTLMNNDGEIYYGAGDHGHCISILNYDNCATIVSLFENKVEIVYGFSSDNSAKTKGYAAHSTYKLTAKENVKDITNRLLAKIHNYILSGELKETINTAYQKILDEEAMKKQEEEDEYQKKRAAHRMIYDKLVAKSKNYTIPKTKKLAIVVLREDFAALSLARKMLDVDEHYCSHDFCFVNTLEQNFKNEDILVWQPKHFHCEGVDSKKHIVIENK